MGRKTSWAKNIVNWCKKHPLPVLIALVASVIIGLFAIAQGIDWFLSKVDPPTPQIVDGEKSAVDEGAAGGNFSVTIQNPTDMAMVVTEATFRAEPPPEWQNADYSVLTIPAVTYTLPYDCARGTKRFKLSPSFKVPAKEVGAVVFVSTRAMKDCQLYISLMTSEGRTKEKEAMSLGEWERRAP